MPIDQPMLLFKLGGRRFLIQWIVTEVGIDAAEVIPMPKRRQVKKSPRGVQA
jgi:hypothetical protein